MIDRADLTEELKCTLWYLSPNAAAAMSCILMSSPKNLAHIYVQTKSIHIGTIVTGNMLLGKPPGTKGHS